MTTRWICLLLAVSAACKHDSCCQDDKGKPVKPPVAKDDQPKMLALDDYEATVYGAGPKATFAPTSSIEHETIARLVPKLLEGAWSQRPPNPSIWQADAAGAGFRIENWTVNNEHYWALLEAYDKPRGAGAYIFRVAPRDGGPVILLEAPHNYYDVGTGRLAADVFFTPKAGVRPRALFTNTIHRYQLSPGDKKKRKHNPADVAHNPEHAYSVATEAFAIAAGAVRVIQLHGFAAKADEDDVEGDVGMINMVVSAGDETGSSPISMAIAAALDRDFGEVKRFPEEAKVLGATTNAQGRLLRKLGRHEFVHVEMSADTRKRLAANSELRQKLATDILDATAEHK